MAQAVIGLGNPEPEYRDTRHNVGQRAADALARRVHASFARLDAHQVAEGTWGGEPLFVVKPGVFMNAAGPAVAWLSAKLHVSPPDLIVIFDDLDLPIGTVRARMKGRAGGHNGARSLIEALGTSDLRRVKIGIGRPGPDDALAGTDLHERIAAHVLSPFAPAENGAIEAACAEAVDRTLRLIASRTPAPA